ncbi:hypothetical protein COT20_02960 [bacterium (Candidatus Gribaldobacteria) CG08_land_8_20_14_0_20_39_15]|uniref:Clp R domain-containing protein n=1 Tax=bacterium (Candidatus Gribaldobacteria) CG08_land_8_20_14_0_20_39_15 TaxID=2014273 RepID=A0A2M6XTT4_9BACT|nr:MAG: hypothetical protein COT20_02960 [bacterium (Candidatus Gribaldobacteria) CG08_land_8_20_14_0_20_39_15]
MDFNLKNTAIYQAVRLSRNFVFQTAKPLMILFFVLAAICLGLISYAVWQQQQSQYNWDKTLAAGILFLAAGIVFGHLKTFLNTCLKKPKLSFSLADFLKEAVSSTAPPEVLTTDKSLSLTDVQDFNLAGFLDFESAQIFLRAFDYAKKAGMTEPTADLLLYCLLTSNNPKINFVFGRSGLDFSGLIKGLKDKFFDIKQKPVKPSGNFQSVLLPSANAAQNGQRATISPGDLLVGLAYVNEGFEKFLTENDFTKGDIANLLNWFSGRQELSDFRKRFWEKENLLKRGSLGRDFASGYTIMLDRYARDIRQVIKKTGEQEIIGHKKEIEQTERILERQELNNVLLVGEPKVGSELVVRAVAQKAFFGKSAAAINYKRFLEFDLTALVAGLGSQEEVVATLETCFSEVANAGNIILVVNYFENFVQEQAKPGAINITGILSRFLSFSSFQIIAAASYGGLHRIIEKNSLLLNLFEKVEVAEISAPEALVSLENAVPFFEKKHKRFIGYKALREIIKLSSRYLGQLPFPEKALRLLDEAMVFLSRHTKDKTLLPVHVQRIVSEKTQIPVGEAEAQEKQKLLNLEELIHQRLINQEEAVEELASALRRARAEVNIKAGPIGSFLFLGPTGVGKTETAKALAAIYFSSEERMIRLDMSEFQNIEDVKRFIGSETEPGLLTTPVKDRPFSLVLLDELEKAHANVLNLFLQVLDEGWLTDGLGRRIDFKNTIIIATSNAGAEMIRQTIQEGKNEQTLKKELLEYVLKQGIFRPEFINRFDALVVFKPLTKENLLDIAKLQLTKLAKGLADKGIKFEFTRDLREKIVELSYSPQFGAREMKRVLQDKLENVLAKAILSGQLKRGSKVEVNPIDFQLIIR